MFNYDYTLEEGGVESSAETNQQVPLSLDYTIKVSVITVGILLGKF
jgi:hypothetical protein